MPLSGLPVSKSVTNLITLKPAHSAANIKGRIVSALKRSADVDAKTITVSAIGDTMQLDGKVHSWTERQIAKRAAWAAPGVNKIENNITVI